MQVIQIVLSVLLGVSLSAAAGFRVFVPFLVMSISAKAGFVQLAEGFSWIGSTPALVLFLVATVIEIAAYYIPYVDNILDVIALPLAAIAGTVLTATVITDMAPMLKWTLAIVAGGGLSTAIHSGTTAIRGVSTATTAGIGNNVVTTTENVTSTILSILAIASPIIAILLLLFIIIKLVKKLKKRLANKKLKDQNQ